jgi:hypothetical protein
MSSWSLLLAASGYEYDGPAGRLRWTPRLTPDEFKSFFCGPEGWGSLKQTRTGASQRNEIAVAEGLIRLTTLTLAPAAPPRQATVTLAGQPVAADWRRDGDAVLVTLKEPMTLAAGQALCVTLT